MKTNSQALSPQAHLEQVVQDLMEALGSFIPAGPQELPQLLQAGLTQLLAGALSKEQP